MLLHIVKKDFLLLKNYLLFILLVPIGIPILIYSRIGDQIGSLAIPIALIMQIIFTQFLINNTLSLAETKYEKGQALLCATPYTRSLVVAGKYVFNLILFAYCLIVFLIVTYFFPTLMKSLSLVMISLVFLFMTFVIGLKMPLEFKFGYEKIKYLFLGSVIAIPYILPTIIKLIPNTENNALFNMIENLSPYIKSVILVLLGFIIYSISFVSSKKIYYKKEM